MHVQRGFVDEISGKPIIFEEYRARLLRFHAAATPKML
jgi:hypothetical protein